LVEHARRCGGVLMCGLLERFNAAVRTAMEIAREPVHATTVRHSPYASRIHTGVAEDLMIHDVDILLKLFGSEVVGVHGSCGVFDERSIPMSEDVVDATLRFANGGLASLSASRLSQRKVRSLTIAEMDRLIEVDLLRQDVTIYRHVGTSEYDEEAGYRQQTIIDIPVLREPGEPLQLQMRHFIALIDGGVDPAVELNGILPPHRVIAEELASSRSASESFATDR
jgi:predicted dehydrogenase